MLAVESLSKSYGMVKAVDEVTFHVDEGEVHGLVGPNGAGKTTTMKSIVGLVIPDSGRITLDGIDLLKERWEKRVSIGFVPEALNMPSWISVRELLYTMARIEGHNRRDSNDMAENALKTFDLSELAEKRVKQLSKGQKKRVLIAQTFLSPKKLYLLDEPLTGLDPEWVARFRSLIRKTTREGGHVVVSSHLLRELEAVVDKVTVINYGRVLFSGTLRELARVTGYDFIKVTIEVDDSKRALEVLRSLGYDAGLGGCRNCLEAKLHSRDEIPGLVKVLVEEEFNVYNVSQADVSLEEAYLSLIRGGHG